jgi:hypothetical protein
LNAGIICGAAHDPVKGIDFPDNVAFSDTANGRIARHFADCLKAVGDQQRIGAGSRSRRGRLTTSMATADNDDIESFFTGLFGGNRVHGGGNLGLTLKQVKAGEQVKAMDHGSSFCAVSRETRVIS